MLVLATLALVVAATGEQLIEVASIVRRVEARVVSVAALVGLVCIRGLGAVIMVPVRVVLARFFFAVFFLVLAFVCPRAAMKERVGVIAIAVAVVAVAMLLAKDLAP